MAGLVQVEKDEEAVGGALCELLKLESAIGIAAKGKFTFAISGGSMLKMLSLLDGDDGIEWSKCVMAFVSRAAYPITTTVQPSTRRSPRSYSLG